MPIIFCFDNLNTLGQHAGPMQLEQICVPIKDEMKRLDPGLLSFFNVNTQEDLDRAQALVVEGR